MSPTKKCDCRLTAEKSCPHGMRLNPPNAKKLTEAMRRIGKGRK